MAFLLSYSLTNRLIGLYQSLPRLFSTAPTMKHSLEKTIAHSESGLAVRVIPALDDNFIAVDPVDPNAMEEAVRAEGVSLTSLLTTHHHWDHADGNGEMARRFPGLRVFGFDQRIPALTKAIGHGESLQVGRLLVKSLHTPCHTSGHICYFAKDPEEGTAPAVFTGDTLFVSGCGKFFEGTPKEMYSALVEKLGALPDDTKVYCGHEYTVTNLKFAVSAERHSPTLKSMTDKLQWAKDQRADRQPTVPSTIGDEKRCNPFMRAKSEAEMGELRAAKDKFKPPA